VGLGPSVPQLSEPNSSTTTPQTAPNSTEAGGSSVPQGDSSVSPNTLETSRYVGSVWGWPISRRKIYASAFLRLTRASGRLADADPAPRPAALYQIDPTREQLSQELLIDLNKAGDGLGTGPTSAPTQPKRMGDW